MEHIIWIDLDQKEKIPSSFSNEDVLNIKKGGKILVKNSVLENIDMIPEEDFIYILKHFKKYLSQIVTSQYIPSVNTMKILSELAPDFQVRFKTEKQGTPPILPISSAEFFEGEKIFHEILEGIRPEWTELQKYKYLYNRNSQMLSYDLNLFTYTPYSNIHEKYARNLFTAMAKNWGICASFAAGYDYLCDCAGLESMVLSEEGHDYVTIEHSELGNLLTDSTADAVRLKFGMQSKSFGISKKQFIEDGHHLEETEASDYEFSELSATEIRALDVETGYLEPFGGEYTDDVIRNLANNLPGNDNFEKIVYFFERVSHLKSIGRPSTCDFEMILNLILSESHDKEFQEGVKIYSFISENVFELPRQIAVIVHDYQRKEEVQYYVLKNGLQSYEMVETIEEETKYQAR